MKAVTSVNSSDGFSSVVVNNTLLAMRELLAILLGLVGKSYVARPFLRHNIGQGNSLFFLHDSWYPDRLLFPKFGHGLLD